MAGQNHEMYKQELKKIEEHLSGLRRCMGIIAIRLSQTHPKSDSDRVAILGGCGFDRNEISQMLSIAPQTASNRLSEWNTSMKKKQSDLTKSNRQISRRKNNVVKE